MLHLGGWLRATARTAVLLLDGMPGELRRGRLVLSEQEIETDHPVPLMARPDQVYENDAGYLVPVDLKFRASWSVLPADRLQLSVTATILRSTTRFDACPVSGHGYIRIQRGAHRTWVRVKLLPDSFVAAAWLAYFAGVNASTSALYELLPGSGIHSPALPRLGTSAVPNEH